VLGEMSAEVLARIRTDDARACFEPSHTAQVEALVNGSGSQPVAQALETILSVDPTCEFELVARLYGGGAWRVALTFDALARSIVAARRQPSVITVDEMYGDGRHELCESSRASLVGAEFEVDGSTKYVRLVVGDTPQQTYVMSLAAAERSGETKAQSKE